MDKLNNPFCPGAGSPPPELAGRDDTLEQAELLFARIKNKRPEKSIILTGLRGVGKTVLLNEMERIAEQQGYRSIFVEAHSDKSMAALLVPHLRSLLFELDRKKGTGKKVKMALNVLKSFANAIRLKVGEIEVGVDLEPEPGLADSGDLQIDLAELFMAVAEAAKEHDVAVALLIDEIQYFTSEELSALIMAMHKMQQRVLPLVLVAAGLSVLPGLAGDSKSYAERLFDFPIIGSLSKTDATSALQDPVKAVDISFSPKALDKIYQLTKGYPYFLQEWGYQAWNHAEQSPIDIHTIKNASQAVLKRLDNNFFRVRFDRLTPGEKSYLKAMAVLGPGPYQTGGVAKQLNATVNKLAPTRANLIKKGMIYSPAHGLMAFTVPLFDEFMLRVIPKNAENP